MPLDLYLDHQNSESSHSLKDINLQVRSDSICILLAYTTISGHINTCCFALGNYTDTNTHCLKCTFHLLCKSPVIYLTLPQNQLCNKIPSCKVEKETLCCFCFVYVLDDHQIITWKIFKLGLLKIF